jgi:hypothetical protein
MTCNKWLLLFAVRIRHAAASCGRAIVADAGTAAAIKLSCILSAQFNYHRYFFVVSNVNHCAAATAYEDRLRTNLTVYRSPSVNSYLALGQLCRASQRNNRAPFPAWDGMVRTIQKTANRVLV